MQRNFKEFSYREIYYHKFRTKNIKMGYQGVHPFLIQFFKYPIFDINFPVWLNNFKDIDVVQNNSLPLFPEFIADQFLAIPKYTIQVCHVLYMLKSLLLCISIFNKHGKNTKYLNWLQGFVYFFTVSHGGGTLLRMGLGQKMDHITDAFYFLPIFYIVWFAFFQYQIIAESIELFCSGPRFHILNSIHQFTRGMGFLYTAHELYKMKMPFIPFILLSMINSCGGQFFYHMVAKSMSQHYDQSIKVDWFRPGYVTFLAIIYHFGLIFEVELSLLSLIIMILFIAKPSMHKIYAKLSKKHKDIKGEQKITKLKQE